jgi:ribulose-bisphosphate carboxylase large chain
VTASTPSLPPVTLDLSGDRVLATYRIRGEAADVDAALAHLCVEQTVEFPADLIADDDIRAHVIARVEEVRPIGDVGSGPAADADVSFAVEVSSFELPQLCNMLFGNISLRPGVRLLDVQLPASVLDRFRGPRFGAAGVRELVGATDRALLATALKPMGQPLTELAAMAGDLAANGIDLIKDDHGLASQPFAPFRERVERCAAAVREANDRTGGRAVYLPSLNVPADRLEDAVRFSLEHGAGGLMVLPGLHGFDAVRALAEDDDVAVPLMAHPSLLGSLVVAPDSGMDHGLVFGTLVRLAGCDLSVFPNAGGRFSFSRDACGRIAAALRAPLGSLRDALPAPAGGMTLERVPEMIATYGADVALLIGGELHRGDRRERARQLRAAAEAARTAPAAATDRAAT